MLGDGPTEPPRPMWIVFTIVFLALGTSIAVLVRNSQQAGLSHVRGPFLAKYTNIWGAFTAFRLSRANSGAAVARFSRSLQKNYGTTVRTGPNTVTILDPRAIQPVYGVRARLDKSDSYTPFRITGVETSLVAIRDETTHAKYKKLVANSYSMSALKGYEPFVDDVTDRWLAVFDRYANNGEALNISRWSHYYCFDVVSMLTLGKPLGFLEGRDVYDLIKATTGFSWYIGLASHIPWLHKIFHDNFIMRRAEQPPVVRFAESVVRARFAEPSANDQGPSDFLSHLVVTHHRQPDLMDQKHIVISVIGNLLAGSLSPSSALKELTRYLATHPESQERLYSELSSAGVTSPASFDAVQDLPYLGGIVREALRLHAQIVVRQERVVPAGGMELPDGTQLPPGTKIGALGQAMTLSRDVFGDDADEYNPERWMQHKGETAEDHAERRARMDRTDMTFGQGSRACIGKNIAILELYKATASLVVSFSFQAVQGGGGAEDTFVKVERRGRKQ